ncbi:flagellar export chaperone FliS [Megalodesulfovibrio paquesii]
MHKAATAYLQTSVGTTSQGEILLMLYEGAIKFLRQAQEKIKERDYAQKGILISKALDIISELESSLNMTKGGEIAGNLHKLYFYCQKRLLQANINMDVAMVEEVVNILSGLKSAYQEVVRGTAAPLHSPSQPATPSPVQPANTPAAATSANAAPDQNSLLSASFWLQKGRAAAQATADKPSGGPSSAGAAQTSGQQADQDPARPVPTLLMPAPAPGKETPPPMAKRLAGSRQYEKISKNTT